jgi:hypothetical protein
VYGEKGVGKSLLVDHAVKGHSGVIKLVTTSTKNDIINALAKRCGIAKELTPDIADFVKALSEGATDGETADDHF